jgi:hypothetical protein
VAKKFKGRLAGSSTLKLLSLLCPTPWSSSLIHLQRRHRTKRRESPLLAKEGTVEGISLSASNTLRLKGSFTCRKVGTDYLTSPPKKGGPRIFYTEKIQRLRPGSNPRTREPEASTQTIRPSKPSIGWVCVICVTYTCIPGLEVRQAPFLLFPSNCTDRSV